MANKNESKNDQILKTAKQKIDQNFSSSDSLRDKAQEDEEALYKKACSCHPSNPLNPYYIAQRPGEDEDLDENDEDEDYDEDEDSDDDNDNFEEEDDDEDREEERSEKKPAIKAAKNKQNPLLSDKTYQQRYETRENVYRPTNQIKNGTGDQNKEKSSSQGYKKSQQPPKKSSL